ncbi:hypothetical protein EYF80_004388 [Liparis tanakae]|uniref:Uncharacterized protein n=1 Tax=Liparis tanakae TaxID=230148 RepID=A0A4Z2J5B0_9TELE|nr:hypothetical protein EYF80_004388 [Liparis tanakae]
MATPSITKNQKSMAETRQNTSPKIHCVVMTVTRAKGMFRMASIMSENARLARRMLMAERMADLWYTIRHTTMFPSSASSRMTTMAKQKKTCRGVPTPGGLAEASAVGVAGSGVDREPMEALSVDGRWEGFSSPATRQQRLALRPPASGSGAVAERTILPQGERASIQDVGHKTGSTVQQSTSSISPNSLPGLGWNDLNLEGDEELQKSFGVLQIQSIFLSDLRRRPRLRPMLVAAEGVQGLHDGQPAFRDICERPQAVRCPR